MQSAKVQHIKRQVVSRATHRQELRADQKKKTEGGDKDAVEVSKPVLVKTTGAAPKMVPQTAENVARLLVGADVGVASAGEGPVLVLPGEGAPQFSDVAAKLDVLLNQTESKGLVHARGKGREIFVRQPLGAAHPIRRAANSLAKAPRRIHQAMTMLRPMLSPYSSAMDVMSLVQAVLRDSYFLQTQQVDIYRRRLEEQNNRRKALLNKMRQARTIIADGKDFSSEQLDLTVWDDEKGQWAPFPYEGGSDGSTGASSDKGGGASGAGGTTYDSSEEFEDLTNSAQMTEELQGYFEEPGMDPNASHYETKLMEFILQSNHYYGSESGDSPGGEGESLGREAWQQYLAANPFPPYQAGKGKGYNWGYGTYSRVAYEHYKREYEEYPGKGKTYGSWRYSEALLDHMLTKADGPRLRKIVASLSPHDFNCFISTLTNYAYNRRGNSKKLKIIDSVLNDIMQGATAEQLLYYVDKRTDGKKFSVDGTYAFEILNRAAPQFFTARVEHLLKKRDALELKDEISDTVKELLLEMELIRFTQEQYGVQPEAHHVNALSKRIYELGKSEAPAIFKTLVENSQDHEMLEDLFSNLNWRVFDDVDPRSWTFLEDGTDTMRDFFRAWSGYEPKSEGSYDSEVETGSGAASGSTASEPPPNTSESMGGSIVGSNGEGDDQQEEGVDPARDGAPDVINLADAKAPPQYPPRQYSFDQKKLEAYIKALEESLQGVEGDSQLAQYDLQQATQRLTQYLQMMSNISKAAHDTAMSIIRNLAV